MSYHKMKEVPHEEQKDQGLQFNTVMTQEIHLCTLSIHHLCP